MKLLPLTKGQFTQIDDDLYELLSAVKWSTNYRKKAEKHYAKRVVRVATNRPVTEYLHWYVAGKPLKGFVVDHINGNTLDNRRENLRVVTERQNHHNLASHRSGRLVGAVHKGGRWQAQIGRDGRTEYLGLFRTEEAAHRAYVRALSVGSKP